MQALIVGAGIGGLTAALCLAKQGHSVTVLEQTAEFAEVGAGLQCGANAMRVLQYLGLERQVQALAVEPEYIDFLHYRSGASLHRVELAAEYRRRYGAAYLHLHRADLYRVLFEAIQREPNVRLFASMTVGDFSEEPRAVTVATTDGQTFTGDLLLGCDGVKSTIRRRLFGPVEPRFTGNVAWRAVVPRDRLSADFMPPIACNFVGKKKHAVIYYLRQQQLVNFVGVVEDKRFADTAAMAARSAANADDEESALEIAWTVPSPWEDMRADYAGWHPRVQELIEAVDRSACYRWALYDQPPLARWSSKRVTLLGDAAHASLPFMASGAAMAIEDARVLARSIAQHEALDEALQCYQRNRMPRTAWVQASSARMGALYHLPHSLLQRIAFRGIDTFGAKQQARLPEYDANTIELV